jgi:hypothetical protein
MKFPSQSGGVENEQVKLIVAGVFLWRLVIDQRALNLVLIALRADIFFWIMGVFGRSYRFHLAMFGLFGDTDIDIAAGGAIRVEDILMVDAYADEKVLIDYAVLAPENVTIRLLAEAHYKHSLKPAAKHWVQQFGTCRPLQVRIAPNKKLHDREIFIDGDKAWNVGQSFKDLATRSLTGFSLQEGELGARKIAAYQELWDASTPL